MKTVNEEQKNDYKAVYFGSNQYGKLTQHIFTKMVVAKPDYYKVGNIYHIMLNHIDLHFCRLAAIKVIKYLDITEVESYVDLGIPLREYREFLLRILPEDFDIKDGLLYFCVFEKVNLTIPESL